MGRASIVSIGDEILNGDTVDTNSAYLARRLLSTGIPAVSFYTVGDRIDSVVGALALACADADVVLVTGGLGPTDDDLTRQAFARFLGVDLELREELLEQIRAFFTAGDRQMPPKNRVQACVPKGAEAITNDLGTAPGIIAQSGGKLLVAMPGVPSEMKRMFERSVIQRLKPFAADGVVVVGKLRCFGAGESDIATILGELMSRQRNPLINSTADAGVITLHIVAAADDRVQAEKMAQQDEVMLRRMLGEIVYGVESQTLADVVGDELARRKKTLAVAESCTGGMLAELLTEVPGASAYFTQGWVTYSNDAKVCELGVSAELIERHGAVSEHIAEAMARGARTRAGTDFAIAVTGIAGPTGGTEQKPVGLVYICVDSDNSCETARRIFSHSRRFIRLRAALTALNMLRLRLLN